MDHPASACHMTAKPTSQAVSIPRALTVKELADLTGVTPIEVIKRLMTNGVMANQNQTIDYDTAVAARRGVAAQRIARTRTHGPPPPRRRRA